MIHFPASDLHLRILAVALAPLLVTVGLFAVYFVHHSVSEAELSLTQRGQNSTRLIAEAATFDLFSNNLPSLKRLLELERKARGASVLGIGKGREWVLYSGIGTDLPTLGEAPLPAEWRHGAMLYFSQPIHLSAPEDGDPYLDQGGVTPTPYFVLIALNRAPVDETHFQIMLATFGMAALTSLLALLLAWRLAGRVSGPLLTLGGVVARLADGKLSERIPEKSSGEIGVLESGVNRMAEALEDNQRNLILRIHAATAELREQKMAAEAAAMAKSRFLAAASHDLRQPMHALSLLVTALRDKLPADSDAGQLTDHIESSAAAMASLLNAILDISRLDAGVVEASQSCFPLNQVLENIRRQFEPQSREEGAALTIMRTRMWLCSDPVLLERILSNLVSNAFRYTRHGHILVGARRTGTSKVWLEVWDTGKGIPPEFHARIFEEYFQLDNPDRHRDKGLGLGLAIVSRLARLLGSRIDLRSEPGRGSCFRLQLERCEAGSSDTAEAAPVIGRGGFTLPLEDALVVFIDDDKAILEATVALFDLWGIALVAGSNAEHIRAELLELGRSPDIILSDYRLQDGRNGIEAVCILREAFGLHIPAALLTGDIATQTIQAIDASGMPVLHKPLKPAKLRAFLSHLLVRDQSATG